MALGCLEVKSAYDGSWNFHTLNWVSSGAGDSMQPNLPIYMQTVSTWYMIFLLGLIA